jgi:citrate lyase subunit beta / citryl-CoA lyase
VSARSYLYVPGDKPDFLAKAFDRGADAVIVDLEDAVAPASKAAARDAVAAWLHALSKTRAEVWVRVNAGALTALDVAAIGGAPALHGLYLAKATLQTTSTLAEVLGGTVRICALIESAQGVLDAPEIARIDRVAHLALGEEDLAADLGLRDRSPLAHIRTQVVVASAAAGIDPPTAPVSTDFRDLDALRASTQHLRDIGFGARSAIHPAQVGVINDVFTPTADELEAARAVVDRYDAALAAGSGVITDDAGRMVDEAIVRAARHIIERTRA